MEKNKKMDERALYALAVSDGKTNQEYVRAFHFYFSCISVKVKILSIMSKKLSGIFISFQFSSISHLAC